MHQPHKHKVFPDLKRKQRSHLVRVHSRLVSAGSLSLHALQRPCLVVVEQPAPLRGYHLVLLGIQRLLQKTNSLSLAEALSACAGRPFLTELSWCTRIGTRYRLNRNGPGMVLAIAAWSPYVFHELWHQVDVQPFYSCTCTAVMSCTQDANVTNASKFTPFSPSLARNYLHNIKVASWVMRLGFRTAPDSRTELAVALREQNCTAL